MGDWGNFGKRKAKFGRRPCYALNPLRGACFAKASQPEGAEKLLPSSRKCGTSEDMSKGARGGRGYGWVDFIRELR